MNLSELKTGDKAIVVKVKGHGSFQKRIMEMGFVRGQMVEVIKTAPFNGPAEYSIMGYRVSLRKNEACLIEITNNLNNNEYTQIKYEGISGNNKVKLSYNQHGKNINIAFVGNPNSGKTSLFNFVSGAKEHVGNYSGVTVNIKEATYKHQGYNLHLNDLPGTYSLTAYTPEELYVRKYIFNNHPDIVVNVIDGTNLERNLYLTTQLIDMDIKVVIALNMYDDIEKSGTELKIKKLEKLLGIPIIPTVAVKGLGADKLFDKIIEVHENNDPIVRHIHINYGKEVENAIVKIRQNIDDNNKLKTKMSPRFLAVKLLEQDSQIIRMVSKTENHEKILKTAYNEINKMEKLFNTNSDTIITDAKYGFIQGALRETLKKTPFKRQLRSDKADKVLTHKWLGFPIFLSFLFLMFYATFQLGAYPMDWIDAGVGLLNEFLKNTIPQGMLNDLITDGIVSGTGSVIIFLPNILILFLFISFMEDTGYMARATFIMDKFMHKLGLHGRSFIPLIMGFGCNVPAIMATRTIRSKNDRLLTMLIVPFMSCSARLPVYILLIGAFFPKSPTLILISLYLIGIILAILTAQLFNKTLFKSKDAPFVMELPPYRMPSAKSIIKHMWDKSALYLKKVGGVILIAVIIIWALGYFPRTSVNTSKYEQEINTLTQKLEQTEKDSDKDLIISNIQTIEDNMSSEQLKESYLGRLGQTIEPIIRPLGFDWRMGIALLSGAAAKEVVVSTMGVILQLNSNAEDEEQLKTSLQNMEFDHGKNKGKKVFSPLVAFSFLIFVLIYFPCVGVISVIAKESGKWRWAIFSAAYTTALAWILSFLIYQVGSLF